MNNQLHSELLYTNLYWNLKILINKKIAKALEKGKEYHIDRIYVGELEISGFVNALKALNTMMEETVELNEEIGLEGFFFSGKTQEFFEESNSFEGKYKKAYLETQNYLEKRIETRKGMLSYYKDCKDIRNIAFSEGYLKALKTIAETLSTVEDYLNLDSN